MLTSIAISLARIPANTPEIAPLFAKLVTFDSQEIHSTPSKVYLGLELEDNPVFLY